MLSFFYFWGLCFNLSDGGMPLNWSFSLILITASSVDYRITPNSWPNAVLMLFRLRRRRTLKQHRWANVSCLLEGKVGARTFTQRRMSGNSELRGACAGNSELRGACAGNSELRGACAWNSELRGACAGYIYNNMCLFSANTRRWINAEDDGPTLNQHWFNVSCLLGFCLCW